MEVPEPVMFVASPRFHLAGQKEIYLEQLLKEPFLLTERNENYRRELDQFLESRGVTLTPFWKSAVRNLLYVWCVKTEELPICRILPWRRI